MERKSVYVTAPVPLRLMAEQTVQDLAWKPQIVTLLRAPVSEQMLIEMIAVGTMMFRIFNYTFTIFGYIKSSQRDQLPFGLIPQLVAMPSYLNCRDMIDYRSYKYTA